MDSVILGENFTSHFEYQRDRPHVASTLNHTSPHSMPAPTNTLLIEGSLEELSDELAQYIDNLRKIQNVEGAIQPEVASLLKEEKNEDAMKKLVGAAAILNTAPEKGASAEDKI